MKLQNKIRNETSMQMLLLCFSPQLITGIWNEENLKQLGHRCVKYNLLLYDNLESLTFWLVPELAATSEKV